MGFVSQWLADGVIKRLVLPRLCTVAYKKRHLPAMCVSAQTRPHALSKLKPYFFGRTS